MKQEEIDATRQDWEADVTIPKTEKEKKDWARNRIEKDLEGNSNMRSNKKRLPTFKPPTQEDKTRMEKLDRMGNPLPGYKWNGYNIVEDTEYKAVDRFAGDNNDRERYVTMIDASNVHFIQSIGINIHRNNLISDNEAYIISEDGKQAYRLKKDNE